MGMICTKCGKEIEPIRGGNAVLSKDGGDLGMGVGIAPDKCYACRTEECKQRDTDNGCVIVVP